MKSVPMSGSREGRRGDAEQSKVVDALRMLNAATVLEAYQEGRVGGLIKAVSLVHKMREM